MGKKKFSVFLVLCLVAIFLPSSVLARAARSGDRGSVEWTTPLVGQETPTEYYLGIGDKLRIFVWKNPDLSGISVINPDGMIYYPLIGKVKAAGTTVEELQDILREKLTQYIRFPDVTITIEEMSGKKIIVLGELDYPGIYTFQGQITIVEAIAMAGGFIDSSKRDSVIVVSNNMTDAPEVRRVNMFKVMRKGSTNPRDLLLKHNDIIYVPKHFIADLSYSMREIQTILNGITAATDGVWDWKREIRWLWRREINVPRGAEGPKKVNW